MGDFDLDPPKPAQKQVPKSPPRSFKPWPNAATSIGNKSLGQITAPARTPTAPRQRPAAPTWYEPLEADLAEREAYLQKYPGPYSATVYRWRRAVVDLARAEDQGDAAAARVAITTITTTSSGGYAESILPREQESELIARAFDLGLEAEALQLRAFFRDRDIPRPGSLSYSFTYDLDVWERVVDKATPKAPAASTDDALARFEHLRQAFLQIRGEILRMDAEQLQRAIRAEAEALRGDYGMSWISPSSQSRPQYYHNLRRLLGLLFAAMSREHEVLLEAATGEATRATTGGSSAIDRATTTARSMLGDAQFQQKGFAFWDIKVPVTASRFTRGGGQHFDAVAIGKDVRKRKVELNYFDVTQHEGHEKEVTIDSVAKARMGQIAFLRTLSGRETGADGKPTAASVDNATALAKVSGFQLHSDDDWRTFLLERLKILRSRNTPDPAALSALVGLIKQYLAAFTVSTEFDISDVAETYLGKAFPRAVTGQLIHDCGVYALRIAYLLSLVRKELALRIRFIQLPAHIGLIVTSEKPGMPTFIIHNKNFVEYSATELGAQESAWRERGTHGEPLATPRARDTDAFLAENAAGMFLPHADMPYRLGDIPELTGRDLKATYWEYWKTKMSRPVLADEKKRDGVSQFHLQYLGALKSHKAVHNGPLLKYWNVDWRSVWHDAAKGEKGAPSFETQFRAVLNEYQRPGANDAQKGAARVKYKSIAASYLAALATARQPLEAARRELVDTTIERLGTALAEHPSLVAKGSTVAMGKRASILFYWEADIEKYSVDVLDDSDLGDPTKLKRLQPPRMLELME